MQNPTLPNAASEPESHRPESVLAIDAAPTVEMIDARSLSLEIKQAWGEIRDAHPFYRTPFFSYEFTEAVARCAESPVQVLVMRRGGRITGLLPIQTSGRVARPAGLGINDAHGLLVRDGETRTITDALCELGLQSYEFHSSPPELAECQQYEVGRTRAFLADLTVDPEGYEHYLRTHSTTIDRQGQKTRRLIREQGRLRLEFDCADSSLLDLLIQWKRDQYCRTHTYDIMSVAWIRSLMHDLHQCDRSSMHGLLSVMFAGDTPVAMHYGMLDGDWLHYWFPVFDPQFGYGSPGSQLFLEIVRECESRGVTKIDMGYGEQRYKHKLTNVITEMSLGLADSSRVRRQMFCAKRSLKARLKNLRGREALKPIARRLLPRWGGSTYET
ncbi:MAG: GNAT family N-acetyltransferase [Aureliella sp.]